MFTVNGADPIKQSNPWAAPAPQENDFWLPPAVTNNTQTTHLNNPSAAVAAAAVPSPQNKITTGSPATIQQTAR